MQNLIYIISIIIILILSYIVLIYKKKIDKLKSELEKYTFLSNSLNNLPVAVFVEDPINKKIIYSNNSFNLLFGNNKNRALKEISQNINESSKIIDLPLDNDIEKSLLVFTVNVFNNDVKNKIFVVLDMDDYKKENNRLLEWKNRYELALIGSNSALWDWDIKEDRVYFSKKWKELMGYNLRDKPETLNAWLSLVDSKDMALVNERLSAYLRGESEFFEVDHRVKLSNPTVWINVKGKAVYDNSGKAVRMVGLVTDISGRKHTESVLSKSQKLFATFMDNLPANAFIKNRQNRYIYLNNFYQKYIGFKEWKNKTPREIFDDKTAELILENDRRAFYEGIKKHKEIVPNESGEIRHFESYKFPIENDDGEKLLCGFGIDITDEKKYKDELYIYKKIFDFIDEAILITDVDSRVIYVNKTFEKIMKYQQREIVGYTPSIIRSALNSKEFYEKMMININLKGEFSGKIFNRTKDGKDIEQFINIGSIRDKNNKITNYFAIYKNINNKNADMQENIIKYQILDKYFNKLEFNDRFKIAVDKIKNTDLKVGILVISLENFRDIENSAGYTAGENVIKKVFEQILKSIEIPNTIFRYDGDKLILILEDIEDVEILDAISNKILKKLNEPFLLMENILQISVNIGYSIFPVDSKNLQELVSIAEKNLYKTVK